ncbi:MULTISPECIES: endo alpha-1,4 polygalactosaminidase [unclassified Microbacterium]|uniref:endo alpha-1,4 polygalactosaminidase n=1 Tax=unclassified Microbacterium TaxID=2609290 RepID=UPI0025EAE103|nr:MULTISPECIES: endo alpha-1,4 polygalactosaminidase [unclassified Microbacterium]
MSVPRPRRRRRTTHLSLAASVAVGVFALAACTALPAPPAEGTGSSADVALPPTGALPDYQLGGAYDPPEGVGIVGRDRSAEPAAGLYSVCYVNGFQTQPGELDAWPDDLLLRDGDEVVFDPDWPDEALLDTGSAAQRSRIAEIVIPWIEGCADSGFQAVEFDNLDSFSRSGGALSLDDNLALAELLVDAAHGVGLAAGQKNAAEHADVLKERAGFDFAVTEECAAYAECGAYTAVYGAHVIDIEYTDQLPRPFTEMCADPDTPASTVLRDRDLVTPDDEGYVFAGCP